MIVDSSNDTNTNMNNINTGIISTTTTTTTTTTTNYYYYY